MKRVKHYINNNLLLKIASFNSVAVLIRVISGFITSKVIAVFIGAEGLALIGNLRNFLTTLESFSTLGFNNGIVKYVAEFRENKLALNKTVGTVLTTILLASVAIGLLSFFNARLINDWIFGPAYAYENVLKILAVSLPFYALNIVLVAIINGLSKYKLVVRINIFSQLLSLLLTLILIWKSHLYGALIATVTIPGLLFLVTVLNYLDIRRFFKLIKPSQIDSGILKNLSSYSLMALFSAVTLPLTYVLIRSYLIDEVSLQDAGFWEAMRRISTYYLMFVSSLMGLYILPRFAQIHTAFEFRKEILHFYKTVLPIFVLGLISIYFLRSFIIYVLFTEEFRPVEHLFLWQLLGDFLKVIASVVAYQLVAKKMVVYYIGIELLSVLTLYMASVYFIDIYGVKGAVIAHFVNFAIYLLVIGLVFKKLLFSGKNFEI